MGIIRLLRLDQPIFVQFCNYGHFTDPTAPWKQIDCAELLADASDLVAERTL